eukprot:CAMPEP_0172584314 /NCGR_PEP_ID=MMETSP1068-20121228/3899_1 /TAXON_ID=35684 /ORGANISM="Pseudopedinella elastica, Strain CCMP716" /LENGTH=70 /DNA_ID=CAMNT_0013378441 /DNA_START=464 /DNA_END=674 /DNA_ORIENTATION=+
MTFWAIAWLSSEATLPRPALKLEHFEEGEYTRFGDATTPGDVKALAPGQANSESPSTAFGASVQKRAEKV